MHTEQQETKNRSTLTEESIMASALYCVEGGRFLNLFWATTETLTPSLGCSDKSSGVTSCVTS